MGFLPRGTNLPKGTGTKFAFELICYIFKSYAIERIIGEILIFNKQSIALHEKLGFTQDETLTKEIQIDDETGIKTETAITMILTKAQWLSINAIYNA